MFRTLFILSVFSFTMSMHCYGQMKPGWFFHDEMIEGLEHPKDTIYIENRKKLEKSPQAFISHDSATINFRTKSGNKICIQLFSDSFQVSKHKLQKTDTTYTIDNMKVYGEDGDIPRKEISQLRIKWGDTWLKIPKKAYSNLYEPNMIEAYISKSKALLYVYLEGSDAAGGYSVKFVFNKTK